MKRCLPILLTVLQATAVSAQPAGDAEKGLKISEQFCTACHDISPGGAFKLYPPSFAAIAVYRDAGQIRSRIVFPQLHAVMPDYMQMMSLEDVADLVAYIVSLEESAD